MCAPLGSPHSQQAGEDERGSQIGTVATPQPPIGSISALLSDGWIFNGIDRKLSLVRANTLLRITLSSWQNKWIRPSYHVWQQWVGKGNKLYFFLGRGGGIWLNFEKGDRLVGQYQHSQELCRLFLSLRAKWLANRMRVWPAAVIRCRGFLQMSHFHFPLSLKKETLLVCHGENRLVRACRPQISRRGSNWWRPFT